MNALKSLHWESLKHRSPEEKKKQRKQHKNSEEKMCNKATARRLQMLSCECQEVLSHSLKNWNSPIAHQPIESNLTIGWCTQKPPQTRPLSMKDSLMYSKKKKNKKQKTIWPRDPNTVRIKLPWFHTISFPTLKQTSPISTVYSWFYLPPSQSWAASNGQSVWHRQHASDCGRGFCVCCIPLLKPPRRTPGQRSGSDIRINNNKLLQAKNKTNKKNNKNQQTQ